MRVSLPKLLTFQDRLYRFRQTLTAILEGIKGLTEGLLAVGATVTLAVFTGFTMFVGL